MINSISGGMPPMMVMPGGNESKLSDEQRSLISETLQSYDVASLSEEDAQAIVSLFEEAGIAPGKEMAGLMAEQGVDAQNLAQLAGLPAPGQMPPPPPADQSAQLDISEAQLSELEELMEQYMDDSTSDEEKESLLSTMQSVFQQVAPEEGLINTSA